MCAMVRRQGVESKAIGSNWSGSAMDVCFGRTGLTVSDGGKSTWIARG